MASCIFFFLLLFFLFWGWRGKAISFLPHQIFTVTVVFARQGLLPILNLWSDKKAGGSVGVKSALKQHGYDLGLPCLGLSHIFTSKVHLLAALLPPGHASSITRLLLIAWRWQLTRGTAVMHIAYLRDRNKTIKTNRYVCVCGCSSFYFSHAHVTVSHDPETHNISLW